MATVLQCALSGRDRQRRISTVPILSLLLTLLSATFFFPVTASAQAGQCVLDDDTYICSGEFPDGLNILSDGFTTLDLADVVGQIDPDGRHGVYFYSVTGGRLTLVAGKPGTELAIGTSGTGNHGLVAESLGTSSGSSTIPALGLTIPSAGNTPGGAVTVENHASIETTGNAAYGILARNEVGGYNDTVTESLENFDASEHEYQVITVDGEAGNVGEEIEGTNGGTFTIYDDGTFNFDPGDIFDNLEEGEEFSTSVTYYVSANGQDFAEATLTITRTQDRDGNFDTFTSVSFEEYNVAGLTGENEPPLFPDMQAYVDQLLADAGVGGVAEAIVVINAGRIETWGIDSHGIVARTVSGSGTAGTDGNFWGRIPTAGGRGENGGGIEVTNDGAIVTHGDGAAGIVATSRGGTGGEGGEGSTWRYGRAGGEGGTGGDVIVSGDGSIHTYGANASGVIALSEGGVGGLGGEGVGFTGGALGGTGGDAGTVMITGSMDITTEGQASHGIWARSVGGSGGQGGADGWAGTGGAGGGGAAADGSLVTILTSGNITTSSDFSHGIFGQSIGGFGGTGGQAVSIFAGFGGDGGSAGSGGEVNIANQESGLISTGGAFSHGILAQSIGGGGGDGGAGVAMGVGVGGDGGAGGHGGAVNVTNEGTILTDGAWSRGIYAQSIGGGGGDGGMSVGIVGIGGSGSGGGDAGSVFVGNSGMIGTEGAYGYGIMAQSIGGGGGDGGFSGGLVSLGGSGALGGAGGLVDVDNFGAILTSGEWAHSIFAQSIGGGGGSGGGSFGTAFTLGGSGGAGQDAGDVYVLNEGFLMTEGLGAQGIHAESIGGGGGSGGSTLATNISIGGSGGDGGLGGLVDITNAGSILTTGDMAQGIFAMSVGGGGGNGGSAGSMFISVGGSGGEGTDGGDVNVRNSGTLTTLGHNSTGIFAQSVGGSGGNGGDAGTVQIAPVVSLSFALGGTGGEGGDGGNVLVENTGLIHTGGSNSHAVFAQSVGGSGGSGGSATTISAVAPVPEVEVPTISANIAIGGRGAGGGEAGTVDVDNDGQITTTGFRSYGVYAQSVGGSGGDGGNATNVQLGIDTDISATIAIGGAGGAGGIGNTVTVDNTGVIHTVGDHSTGVFAQSVGGGGGSGGDATTVKISLTTPPDPTSPEDFIPTPSMSFDLAVGGDGGVGGVGGDVDVTNEGTIITEGNFATGVMAQSVGGSGGTGGDARIISVELSADPMDFNPLLDLTSFSTTMVFGGTGGAGGHGGDVTVTNSEADIATFGAFSHGIVAQSVGGGGGSGGSAMTFEFSNTDLPIDVPVLDDVTGLTSIEMTLQGSGDGGGDGGDITVNSNGNVWTEGDFAMGVVAQSVGGGGGLAGFYNPHGVTNNQIANTLFNTFIDTEAGLSFAGSTGGAGNAGDILVNHTGNIQTLGDGAHGLFAQSAAGEGIAGNIDVTLNGSILAFGEDAAGIFAQSGGGAGNGTISLIINEGTVMGGYGNAAGIRIDGGTSNTIWSDGLITTFDGVDGYAIRSGNGDEVFENFGTVTGSIDLGLGSNLLFNAGVINAGSEINLGSGNLLRNEADFAPGGMMNVALTTVWGDFEQSGQGMLWYDLDYAGNVADRINIYGTADLAGTLMLNTMNAGKIMPGSHEVMLLTSTGGIGNFGLNLVTSDTAVVDFALFSASDNEYMLHYNVDFAPTGLNFNQAAMGEHVNEIQLAGGSPLMEPLTASLVAMPNMSTLAAAYDQLSPHVYVANQMSRLYSSLDFERAMHSCPVRDGDLRFAEEGECIWMRASTRDAIYAANDGTVGGKDYAKIFNVGWQRALTPHWHGGLAFGVEDSEYRIRNAADRDGMQVQFGGILKGRYGSNLVNFSALTGFSSFDTRRTIGMPQDGNRALGDRDIRFFAAHVGYARLFERESWYVKPGVDVGWTQVSGDPLIETGGGGAGLRLKATNDTYLTSRFDLQVGGEIAAANDVLYRPYVRGSYMHIHSGTANDIEARLAGAPESVPYFRQVIRPDDNLRSIEGGIDILTGNQTSISLAYTKQFGDTWDVDSFLAKLVVGF